MRKTKESTQRDRIIAYKQFFGTPEGKEILFDLMNRYYVLNTHNGEVFKEGQRSVVLGIMSQCNIDLATYDRILKGEE